MVIDDKTKQDGSKLEVTTQVTPQETAKLVHYPTTPEERAVYQFLGINPDVHAPGEQLKPLYEEPDDELA